MEAKTETKLKSLIETHPVVLFMKGTKEDPMCGFSAHVVQILNSHGVDYEDINVLDDWDLREGIKQYSNWPTIPQLYIKSEFIGGCDIVMDLQKKGKLKTLFESL